MKKFIIGLLTLIISTQVCYSIDPLCPRWEEFAPREHVNAQYNTEEDKFREDFKIIAVSSVSYYTMPYAITRAFKAKKAKTNNYWYKRRLEFEKEIALCNAMPSTSDRYACYMDVRKLQAEKTYQYNKLRIEQQKLNDMLLDN